MRAVCDRITKPLRMNIDVKDLGLGMTKLGFVLNDIPGGYQSIMIISCNELCPLWRACVTVM